MYNVNVNGLGVMESIEQGLWDALPGDAYKGGKFIVEPMETTKGGEGISYVEKMSPPMSKEAADAMAAELKASLAAKREGLAARGVKVGTIGDRRIRAVTHHGIESQDIENALTAFREVLQAGR